MTSLISLSWTELGIRVGCAFLAGALIGLERESHGRAAGLRTTAIVCVAAAIAMILSEQLFTAALAGSQGGWRPDPARLAAGILTGIGFLGAGVIMHEGEIIRGVTTAAALWLTTVLGLAFGAGHLVLGSTGLVIGVVTLFALPSLERWIRNDWYGVLHVTVNMDGISDGEIRRRIEQFNLTIQGVELEYNLSANQRTIRCRVKYKSSDVFDLSSRVVGDVTRWDGVVEVKWL